MFSKLANMPKWHHHGCGGTMSIADNKVRCSKCGLLKTSKPTPVAHTNAINNVDDHSLVTDCLLAEGLSSLLHGSSSASSSSENTFNGFGGGESGGGGASDSFDSNDDGDGGGGD